jgi:hypothetical protein
VLNGIVMPPSFRHPDRAFKMLPMATGDVA